MNNPGKNQSKSRKVNEIRLMIKRDRCLSNSSRTIKWFDRSNRSRC